jgi:hypothetical protein
MGNRRYYDRRRQGLCGDCGTPANGAYCEAHREARRLMVARRRSSDRPNYNKYMRDWKASLAKETRRIAGLTV